MVHTSYFCPRIFPYNGTNAHSEIDRLQDFTGTVTLDRTKLEEIGRDGLIDWRVGIPDVSISLRQYEYGSLEIFQQLANTTFTDTRIDMTDFKTSAVDLAGYKTDDDGSFLGTIWYPKLRLTAIGMAIGDPDAAIERTFTLVGEDEIILQGNNQYLIHMTTQVSNGGSNVTFDVTDGGTYPNPADDPDNSGRYLLRVSRIRNNTASDLEYTTDYTFSAPSTLTVNSVVSGDCFKVVYSSGTVGSYTVFTNNDTDAAAYFADHADIYLETTNYVYRLQSVAVDITFDRFDIREIGNKSVVARGVRDITTRVTLGRILHAWTIEEVLRYSSTFDKIDVRELRDDLNLKVEIYSNNDKPRSSGDFKIGYEFTDLAPVGFDTGVPLNDYVNRGATLEGEQGYITTDYATL